MFILAAAVRLASPRAMGIEPSALKAVEQEKAPSVHLVSSVQNPQNCTVFYAADDQVALGGNNEDSINPRTKIWFIPPEEGKYGVAFVGYEDMYPQGAVNDHGLFFDGLAVRVVRLPREAGKPVYAGNLMVKAMTMCATVECVFRLFERYSRGPGTWNGQFLIGDGAGNSAILEPLATIPKQGNYQVATNFFQSEVKPQDRNDRRYKIANEILGRADKFSVDLFREVLEATHQEDGAQTLYSTIYDLKRGRIYLYFFHDFEQVVELEMTTELAEGIHSYDIPSLFPSSEGLAFGKWISDEVEARQTALARSVVRPELFEEYAGRYEIDEEQYVQVKSEGNQLYVRMPALPWVGLLPESDTRFFQVLSDGTGNVRQVELAFVRDQMGHVNRLEMNDSMGSKVAASRKAQVVFDWGWIWFLAGVLGLGSLACLYVRRQSMGGLSTCHR